MQKFHILILINFGNRVGWTDSIYDIELGDNMW